MASNKQGNNPSLHPEYLYKIVPYTDGYETWRKKWISIIGEYGNLKFDLSDLYKDEHRLKVVLYICWFILNEVEQS